MMRKWLGGLGEDVDILDGTPFLDIKPYIPCFDRIYLALIGLRTPLAGGMEQIDEEVARRLGRRGFRERS
ncbi:MAG: SAM-dependent methyltransferase [bacterium]|nr:SAM-dependent methyltransferase [bacterium]